MIEGFLCGLLLVCSIPAAPPYEILDDFGDGRCIVWYQGTVVECTDCCNADK